MPNETQCGVCQTVYQEFTEKEEQWIGCDSCNSWFYFTCLGITSEPETFLCSECCEYLNSLKIYTKYNNDNLYVLLIFQIDSIVSVGFFFNSTYCG